MCQRYKCGVNTYNAKGKNEVVDGIHNFIIPSTHHPGSLFCHWGRKCLQLFLLLIDKLGSCLPLTCYLENREGRKREREREKFIHMISSMSTQYYYTCSVSSLLVLMMLAECWATSLKICCRRGINTVPINSDISLQALLYGEYTHTIIYAQYNTSLNRHWRVQLHPGHQIRRLGSGQDCPIISNMSIIIINDASQGLFQI